MNPVLDRQLPACLSTPIPLFQTLLPRHTPISLPLLAESFTRQFIFERGGNF
jgi:hypothetical protein